MYRTAIIGAGGRAREHARAYRAPSDTPASGSAVRGAALEAVADIDAGRLDAFAADFRIPARFDDYRRMLAEVKPDLVHLVTNPHLRVEPVRACAQAGVKAVIVEKPLGLSLADLEGIETISRDTGLKVIVNTQRRYFRSWAGLCDVARSGQAGRIVFIRVEALSAVFCTGSHYLDMIQMLLGDPDPVAVWAAAYGAHEYHSTHPGPSSFLASVTYPQRTQLLYEASQDGVGELGSDVFFYSTSFNIWTERGRLWWTEASGWGYQLEGMSEPRRHDTLFAEDDKTGQAAFTQAAVDWLDDPGKPHANRLETAAKVFRILAAMVQSAAEGRRIDYATTGSAPLRDASAELRAKLEAAEGVHPERQQWAWNRPRE